MTQRAPTAGPRQLKPVADPSREIQVDWEVNLEENDLADEQWESHPKLVLYLSGHFERSVETGGLVNVEMYDEDPHHIHAGHLVGSLKREYAALPQRACICAQLYVVHRNDHDNPCWSKVGTAHVNLRDVIQTLARRTPYVTSMEMLLRSVAVTGAAPIRKALVHIRVTAVRLCERIGLVSDQISALDGPDVEHALTEYVDRTIRIDEGLRDTYAHTERMRAPYTLSSEGIESTGRAFLPISAFALLPTPSCNEAYFANALANSMARMGYSVTEYFELDLEQHARIMASLCVYGVQTFDYISDTIEMQNRRLQKYIRHLTQEGDDFDNSFHTCSGDCEDGCSAIQTVFLALCSFQAQHAILRDLQLLAKHYIAMQMLTVVHGAKIGDEEGYGAHLCDVFVPIRHANAMLARTAAGRALLKRCQPVAVVPVMGGVSDAAPEVPFLMGEGTGIIDPLGAPVDPMADERRYVAEMMPSSSFGKREIPNLRGQESPFYHGFLLAITSQWIDHGVGALVVGSVAREGAEMTRGAAHLDLMAGRTERIALMPHPRMPAKVMAIAEEAVLLAPPPRPLTINAPLSPARTDPLLDRLCDGIRALGHPAPARKPRDSIDLFVRAHQYDAQRINALLSEAARMPRLYDATYVEERITDDITSFRVRLWVK